ncbi:MAG: sialidase family protein [Phycisphaerae bacterium]
MLKMIGESIIFKNPDPVHKSLCANFPSLTKLPNGDLLCLFRVGQARASYDGHLELARSADGGKTWKWQGPVNLPPVTWPYTFLCAAVSCFKDGALFITGIAIDAKNPDEPVWNPQTEGLKECKIVTSISRDNGYTWGPLNEIYIGLKESAADGGTIELMDGRLMQAFEVWKSYDVNGVWDQKAGVVFSDDSGKTWGSPVIIAHDPKKEKYYWDTGLCQLRDGTLLGLMWTNDNIQKKAVNVHRVLSGDGGKTWSPPAEVNLVGELSRPIQLENGQILCVYNDRKKPAGIKAVLSSNQGASWNTAETSTLWAAAELAGKNNPFADFLAFDFGMPSVQQLPDGTIGVAFYAYENHVCHIRFRKFVM